MFLLTDGDIHRIPCNIGAETFRDSFIRLKMLANIRVTHKG